MLSKQIRESLEDLCYLNKSIGKEIILKNNDFRFLHSFFDYDELYLYKDNLCGSIIGSDSVGIPVVITTFEIPIFSGKQISDDISRFVNRSQDYYKLITNLQSIKINNKQLSSIVFKSKKIEKKIRQLYSNFILLA